ncbi:MAG: hypothetical protein LQ342_001568 [Letrouitia transgressa]|nr:MAG: hypothetical protein LQ342_001568 [Letrouitia transgressa]
MAPLDPRSQLTDNASATASSGWSKCMAKAYCKWPAIVAILVAVLVACTALYCCCRCLSCCCCDCLSGGRYRRGPKKHRYADLSSPPHPYPQAQAHDPEPPRYVQFERSGFAAGAKERHADSLPEMPMWDQGKERRVFDDEVDDGGMALRKETETGTGGGGGVELRKLDTPPPPRPPRSYGGDGEEQRAPMLPQVQAPAPDAGGAPVYTSYASPQEYKAYTPYHPSAQREV